MEKAEQGQQLDFGIKVWGGIKSCILHILRGSWNIQVKGHRDGWIDEITNDIWLGKIMGYHTFMVFRTMELNEELKKSHVERLPQTEIWGAPAFRTSWRRGDQ